MSYDCVIVFDQNEHGTYFTGQVVTGKVLINFNKPKKVKGITLQICGFASCQWRQKRNSSYPQPHTKKPKKHCFYGREDFIAATTYLIGSPESKTSNMEGSYTFPFSCAIPANCPSSFEGTFGHIRYLTKVTFIRSGASNRTFNKGFTVLKMSNLNNESNLLRLPVSNDAAENVCLFLSKQVKIRLSLPQTGYVPGQNIEATVIVDNRSNMDCKKIQLTLNVRATYQSNEPYLRMTTEQICLTEKLCGSVARQSHKIFKEVIRVPPTAPTCEHLSKVVRVSYEICAIAIMNPLMTDPRTSIPITIGNVPLIAGSQPLPRLDEVPSTSTCAMQLAGGSEHYMYSDQIAVQRMNSESLEIFETVDEEFDENEWELVTPDAVELPPPTYEEAMFMTTNIADDDVNTVSENANFTPRFPVFNIDPGMYAAGNMGQTPPPNKPQKRRRRRRPDQEPNEKSMLGYGGADKTERMPVESPVQI